MGFFSKVFKGIGKVFRKVGRGLKKVVSKFGKFMGKLGIVGQIGLSLLLPGIGSMLGNLAGSMMSTTLGGLGGAIIKGAGTVLNAAVNIGTKVGSTFKTITEGVTKVLGEVATAGLDKLGLSDSAFGKYLAEKGFTGDISGAFTNVVSGVKASVGDLFSSNTLTGLNKYAADAALATQTAASTEAVLKSVPDSLAAPEVVGTPTVELPSTGLQQTEGAGFFGGTAQPLQSPVIPEGSTYSPSLLEPPAAQTGIPTTNVKGFVEQKVEDVMTAAKELPGNLVDEAVDYVKNAPARIGASAVEGLESAAKTGVMRAVGIDERPIDKSTYVQAAVPYFDTSANIYQAEQMAPMDFGIMQTPEFNLNPYGHNALVFNSKQMYDRTLQRTMMG